MIEKSFSCLFYCLGVLSCLGLIYLVKRRNKSDILFFLILFVAVLWRSFFSISSSRYCSILVLLAAYPTATLFKCLFCFKNKKYHIIFLLIIVFAILELQTKKNISSYNNSYILDIQEEIQRFNEIESQNGVYTYMLEKDFQRVVFLTDHSSGRLKQIDVKDGLFDFTDFYIRNSTFFNSLYIICPECKHADGSCSSLLSTINEQRIKKHSQYNTNRKKSKVISVYKHLSFVPAPEIDVKQLYGENAVLKAYDPAYDAFIYQLNNKLIWIIGKDIDRSTEIVLHLMTNEPSLLPLHRQQYGFDNLAFRAGDAFEVNKVGHYRIFERTLSQRYPITSIRVGFMTGGINRTRLIQLSE